MQSPFATAGMFSWTELMTPDPRAAKEFYGKLFGWTFEKVPGFDYELARLGDQMIAGLMAMPPGCPPGRPPCWNTYVTVAAAEATCAAVKSQSGQVLVYPRDIPQVGRFAVIQDPQGAAISMFQWAR